MLPVLPKNVCSQLKRKRKRQASLAGAGEVVAISLLGVNGTAITSDRF